MYVAIDRKPENGCEIQNAGCGDSGVMIRLKIVKTAEEDNASAVTDDDGNNHGTNVLKFLVEPWVRTDRCTCGDIDEHNRHCQDNLKTEKKLEMKKWDMRVNLTIFSMIVVDTWLVYSQV